MRRLWFLILALSLGLNAGLVYTTLSQRAGRHELPRGFARGHDFEWSHDDSLDADRPVAPARPPLDRRGPALRRLDRMGQWLELDATQRTEMGKILDEMLPQILAERDSAIAARRAAHEEYFLSQADPGRIRAIVRRLSLVQARLDSLVAEAMLREAALLTPEQRARYFQAMPWERAIGSGPGPHRRDW